MSSICGIVNFEGGLVNFDALNRMGKAMILRGRDQSGAYVNRGVGLQHNRMIFSGGGQERQPYTAVEGERCYTIVFDGEIYNTDELASLLQSDGFKCAAEAVLRCYMAFGYECVGYLDGAFAFAIFDEYRTEVFMARDSLGAKPLYYMNDNGIFVFASEIKGLIKYRGGGFEVDTKAILELISSPIGMVRGEDIYRGISKLPSGSFAVYSRLGLQISDYSKKVIDDGFFRWKSTKKIIRPLCDVRRELGSEIFNEILVAFDYPQFDEYMLGYIKAVKESVGQRSLVIEDRTLMIDVSYACERADRIGMMNGVMIRISRPDGENIIKNFGLYKMEKRLSSIAEKLLSDKNSFIFKFFGNSISDIPDGERDIRRRIRMCGMIIETELWFASYPIITS